MPIKENLQKEKTEFSNFKNQINRERKIEDNRRNKSEKKVFLINLKADSKQTEFECDKCDECFPNENEMKMHVLVQHVRSSSTQTESVICVDRKVQVKRSEFTNDKNVGTLKVILKCLKVTHVSTVVLT